MAPTSDKVAGLLSAFQQSTKEVTRLTDSLRAETEGTSEHNRIKDELATADTAANVARKELFSECGKVEQVTPSFEEPCKNIFVLKQIQFLH